MPESIKEKETNFILRFLRNDKLKRKSFLHLYEHFHKSLQLNKLVMLLLINKQLCVSGVTVHRVAWFNGC